MRITRIKFPIEEGSQELVPSQVLDFLSSAILDGDLEITLDEYRGVSISDIRFDSKLVDGKDVYRVYNVDLKGEDAIIQVIETWFEQFDKPLN